MVLVSPLFAMYDAAYDFAYRQAVDYAKSTATQWAYDGAGYLVNVGSDIISGSLSTPGRMSLRGSNTPMTPWSAGSSRSFQQMSQSNPYSPAGGANLNKIMKMTQSPSSASQVPAQFINGRGAELAVNNLNIERAIKFKTGEKTSRRSIDAFGREARLFHSQILKHGFAFKCLLEPPSYVRIGESLPINRFVVHNVFRHNSYLSGNVTGAAGTQYTPLGGTTWNNSLGPDRSYVRKSAALNGTAYAPFDATTGLNTDLSSPYRYPQNGGVMFSRLNRQHMENMGWNANPLKLIRLEAGLSVTPDPIALQVYSNAPSVSGSLALKTSFPNQAPKQTTPVSNNPGSFYYRSQFDVGNLAYNFTNDGLNPVVIDVVITRLKKNDGLADDGLGSSIAGMIQAYQRGYLNYATINQTQMTLQGESPQVVDVTTNARGPFLPAKALGQAFKNTNDAGGFSTLPWKQVARDQFIVAGGGSREWKMQMQALDYDARRYDQENAVFDDLTYIVSFGISGMPMPYVETGTGATPATAIIDRRGTACNVSVTGLYTEKAHPVYLTKPSENTFINGTLDIPGFSSGTASMATADLANLGQAVRTTSAISGILYVAPFNTTPGA